MIEYLAPSGGGGNTLNTITTDISSGFEKLKTEPITILAAQPDKFIIPIYFFIGYNFGNIQADGIMINGVNLLSPTNIYYSAYFSFNAADLSNTHGFLTFPVVNSTFRAYSQVPNITINTPIVLTAPTDSIINVINALKIQIGYYLVDTL
jgi:hypothetical protein